MPEQAPKAIENLLTHIPLFNGLAPDEISRLARGASEVRASKGDILFHKGDPCIGFHLIVYGQVKLAFISAQGSEKVVEILGEGQSFGEALMFMERPYIVYAQALSDSLMLHMSKSVIFEEMERDHQLCRKMLAGMSMRLHQLMSDLESYSLHSGTQRIIAYLVRNLSEEQLVDQEVIVTLPTRKGVIASRLNLTQEHFSRILHDLSNLGLIAVEGKKIRIPSVQRLIRHQC